MVEWRECEIRDSLVWIVRWREVGSQWQVEDWIVAQLAGRNGGRSYVVIEREVIGGAAPLLGIDAWGRTYLVYAPQKGCRGCYFAWVYFWASEFYFVVR